VNAAILFEPDGYLLTGPRLMGRQAAGNGFLRAAVAARGEAPLSAFTPHRQSAEIFQQTVTALDPAAQTAWIPAQRLDLLAQIGVLYRPDQLLGIQARQRLRIGPGAYSLCGVTHTLSTQGTLDAIAKILTEPVMPWDALVCTSNVAKAVVTAVLDHQADYLRWRTRQPAPEGRPLLPVIPLGVHCDDFAFTADDRATARQALGLAQADVAVLFAGRLSINGKAHPHALLHALQTLVTETGSPVVLVIAGQAYNKDTDALFRSGLADFCPSVRTVFVDGKDPAAFRSAWAGSDIFASLADSIQETFGLTPLEAMASGLPALVTDWNGYRDTVRDGVDGFRIKTWAPPPGAGESIAALFEAGAINYEGYLSRSGTGVAVDNVELAERLRALVADPDLRRRMGEAGRARARAEFDWSVVFRRYQALWAEQGLLRRKAADDPTVAAWLASAPRTGADHLGPFDTFASYPTHQISPATLVTRAPQASGEAYRQLIASRIMALWTLAPEVVDNVLSALADGPLSIADLGAATGITSPMIAEVAARLAKMGVLHLSADDGA
jgi:glycosyltransferase involved in cell wall biosynthesis